MELDVSAHPHSVLKEYVQGIDKQKEIELYYELLSSGHSVGEILNSLGIMSNSKHGNVTTAEDPPSGFDSVAPDVMSEAALMGVAPANTQRTPGLTPPVEAESVKTEDAPLNKVDSGDGENLLMRVFPDLNLTSLDQQPYIPASAAR